MVDSYQQTPILDRKSPAMVNWWWFINIDLPLISTKMMIMVDTDGMS